MQHHLFDSFTYKQDEKPSFIREASVDLTFRKANTKYLTHDFHSYPAKFIPQLATWLIQQYSEPGDTVLDPFAGSGTTLVEALLNDRNALGIEINRIGRLTSMAKTTPIESLTLNFEKDRLYRNIASLVSKHIGTRFFGFAPTDNLSSSFDLWVPSFENFERWFLPEVIIELAAIRHEIMKIENEAMRTLALVAFSSIVKKVSNARTEERNPKLRKEARAKPDTIKVFKAKLDRMSIDIIQFSDAVRMNDVRARIVGNDAREIALPEEHVHLIVTSPPYAYAMDYVRMHKLSLYWLGENELTKLDELFIGTERVYANQYSRDYKFHLPFTNEHIEAVSTKNRKKGYILYKYFVDMESTFREMHRVLKKGGHATVVIGNSTVQQVVIPTHECFNEIAHDVGFDVRKPLVRSVPRESKGLSHVHAEHGGEMVDKEYINVFVKK